MDKLLLLIYDSGIDADLIELFDRLELDGYTQLFEAVGKGHGGKRFGDAIFPGTNNVALIALPETQVPALLAGLRELAAQFRKPPPLRVLSLNAEVVY